MLVLIIKGIEGGIRIWRGGSPDRTAQAACCGRQFLRPVFGPVQRLMKGIEEKVARK
jgi:hypothetical protein